MDREDWYIYTMEYYSAIKREEIGSFVEMWMDLESVTQSEIRQKEKNKYRIIKAYNDQSRDLCMISHVISA